MNEIEKLELAIQAYTDAHSEYEYNANYTEDCSDVVHNAAQSHLHYKREIEPLVRELVEAREKMLEWFNTHELPERVHKGDTARGEFYFSAAQIAAKLKGSAI